MLFCDFSLAETNYIPYERSTSQLSDYMLHIQLGDNLRGQNHCHSRGAFWRPIAGMTSQIRGYFAYQHSRLLALANGLAEA